MDTKSKKVVLITGASSGMGKSAAEILLEQGYIVYGAARRTDKMQDLVEKGLKALKLDITNDENIIQLVAQILQEQGRIDILINNAGYGSYGSVEEVPLEEARRQFDVNIFGLARLTQLVIPHMRDQKSGRIVNISSMGGKIYSPFGAWYHATKFALEGWSDCLRLELKQFGIDVVLVEPGGIQTEWNTIAMDSLQQVSGKGPYKASVEKMLQASEKNASKLSSVDLIAREIVKAATNKKPKTRYLKGHLAKTLVFIRKWGGDRVYDKMIMGMLK